MSQEIMIKGEKCTLRKGKHKMLSVTYYKASKGKGEWEKKTFCGSFSCMCCILCGAPKKAWEMGTGGTNF